MMSSSDDDDVVVVVVVDDVAEEREHVPLHETALDLHSRQLVALGDSLTRLTRLTKLVLLNNAFAEVPGGVLAMPQLSWLSMSYNRLSSMRELVRVTTLRWLFVSAGGRAVVWRSD